MEFLCSKCGACCASAGKLNGVKYGLPIKEDGSCANLIGNICSIYDNRSDICRVDKMNFNYSGMTKKEYFIKSTKACHKLIDDMDLSEDYKINIEKYN